MTRTRIWRPLAGVMVTAFIISACGGETAPSASGDDGGDGEGGTLVVVSPGGSYGAAMNAAYFQPFENETGVDIQLVEGGEDAVASVRAQVESGNVQWDLVLCAPAVVVANRDIYEDVEPTSAADDLVYTLPANDKATLNDVEAFPLVTYSTEAFPDGGPTDAAGFFDTETYPGPRGIPDIGLETAFYLPALALIADGVAVDDLLPLDLDRAYEKLDAVKPDIRVVWTTFTQSQDIMRSGEVVVNLMSDGRALQLINAGEPVAVSFQDGFRGSAAWCIPNGAPNGDVARQFLDFIQTSPEQQAVFTSLTYYGPPTNSGVEAARNLGVEDFSTLHNDELIPDTPETLDYIEQNSDELLNRWNAWLSE